MQYLKMISRQVREAIDANVPVVLPLGCGCLWFRCIKEI